ncbi:MAG: hypothetical protein KF881_12995 [Acidobacteria bacterium]|nr:hypothetical protein [Acidobacteriota bacterium]
MSENISGRSFGDMLLDRICAAAMDCISENQNLFESDWGVLVFKRDPETGKYLSETYCCDEAVA